VLIQSNFFIHALTEQVRCQSIKYPICHQGMSVLNQVLTGHFFLVFHCTIDCEQYNLVCCHNDTLACSPYIVLIISSVSGIMNVLYLVMLAAVCLLILGSLVTIIIDQCAQ